MITSEMKRTYPRISQFSWVSSVSTILTLAATQPEPFYLTANRLLSSLLISNNLIWKAMVKVSLDLVLDSILELKLVLLSSESPVPMVSILSTN